MKTILILGGFGFIGSNILQFIDKNLLNEYEVILFDKANQHIYGLKFKCVKKIYSGDFGDITCIVPIFKENKIDLVFHFISTTTPSTSNNIRFDIESNLISTIDFLNLMVKENVQNIVYLSSGGAVYGSSFEKKKEISQNFPTSSYGIVKIAIEKYLMLYSLQGLIKPLILRLSNPYGPYHYSMKQGVLNVALQSAINQEQFIVWGDGENTKDYIFIDDFSEILFKLIGLDINNEIINIGSGELCTINNILTHIKNIYPKFNWIYTEAKHFDTAHFELDLTKLNSIIGPFSYTPLKEGLIRTNKWVLSSTRKL